MVDSKGIISKNRKDLDKYKKELLKFTNKENKVGSLKDALVGADVFVGVSAPNILTADDISQMNEKAIVLAMANPVPEIMPDEAKKGGAFIVGTGRSDFPNQINNSLAFPGIFKGALEAKAKRITKEMKLAAAYALSKLVKNPTPEKIIPGPFDGGIIEAVSKAVRKSI
jgi:malate dehydrogenase (oxaloacetate-decarboxylating)